MLRSILFVAIVRSIACLDCYQCHRIPNITDCHHVVECAADEYCYTDTEGVGEDTSYTLGCRSKQACLASAHKLPGASVFGRSVKEYHDCSQCCAVDGCNKIMCSMNIQAVGTGECKDDPEFNCFFTSSLYTLCDDVHHAKLVCRQHCGLCNLVDGQWSTWNTWSDCDHTCGNGTRSRSRQCDNPAPQDRGMACIGASKTMESCMVQHCPDGSWSSWSPWTGCPVSCAGGLSERYRQCNNPTPSTYGRDCQGQTEEFKVCNSVPCTGNGTDGQWSDWSQWSNCSSTCTRTRTRSCNNPPPTIHGHGCAGDSIEKLNCDFVECAVPVRLVNGSNQYEGRLEVYHNGTWGTVCRDAFTDIDAGVVCGMLNYPKTEPLAISASSMYGTSSLPILLDDVSCVGDEHSLFACSHSNWGVNDCSHAEDVGVSCRTNLQIRLAGGDTHRGRVEVSLDGSTWGTICNSGFSSDDNGAKVVCKMLGYSGQYGYYNDGYKHGTGNIYLSDITCTGAESSLLECDHSVWGSGSEMCDHSQDAGVTCR